MQANQPKSNGFYPPILPLFAVAGLWPPDCAQALALGPQITKTAPRIAVFACRQGRTRCCAPGRSRKPRCRRALPLAALCFQRATFALLQRRRFAVLSFKGRNIWLRCRRSAGLRLPGAVQPQYRRRFIDRRRRKRLVSRARRARILAPGATHP